MPQDPASQLVDFFKTIGIPMLLMWLGIALLGGLDHTLTEDPTSEDNLVAKALGQLVLVSTTFLVVYLKYLAELQPPTPKPKPRARTLARRIRMP